MNNINILQVRPNTSVNNNDPQGAYVSYNIILKPTDHNINGSFTATNEETRDAVNNNDQGNWNGFKKLVYSRLQADVKSSISATAPNK